MSPQNGKLLISFSLPRDEDPELFDHLARFTKGPARSARLKTLVRKGLTLEQLQTLQADMPRVGSSRREAGSAAVMDQMFTAEKG